MVFVTVGSTANDFSRLLIAIDNLVVRGKLSEVVAQIGNTTYRPQHYEHFDYAPFDQIRCYVKDAEFVISHAGTATLDTCLELQKRTIVVPRLRRYGEHPDDHQMQLAKALENKGRVLVAMTDEELERCISGIAGWQPTFAAKSTTSMIDAIDRSVAELLTRRRPTPVGSDREGR